MYNYQDTRDFVIADSPLLLRNIWFSVMEGRSSVPALRALLAYRNDDGGFGNGLEPDLLLPHSTAIAAETALYYLYLLDCREENFLEPLANWALANLNAQGFISHPPAELFNYPHQPWWENADDRRILSVTGFLKKLGSCCSELEQRVEAYAHSCPVPQQLAFYDYPLFIYALYSPGFSRRQEIIDGYLQQLPTLLAENKDHFPLFTRYWSEAIPLLDKGIIQVELELLLAAFEGGGGLPNPYPKLPWWQGPFTMDAVLICRKYGLL